MEERIITYFERWIAALTPHQLAKLLVFWTASNVHLPEQVLKVEFNSQEGLARRPTAVTCSDTLELSRMYFSEKDFADDMAIIFRQEANIMDAL